MKTITTVMIAVCVLSLSACATQSAKDGLPTAAVDAPRPDDPNPAIVCKFGSKETEQESHCTTPRERQYEKQTTNSDLEIKP